MTAKRVSGAKFVSSNLFFCIRFISLSFFRVEAGPAGRVVIKQKTHD